MIGASKLNQEKVETIKGLFKHTELSDGDIAKIFNVSRVHINRIRNGQRWNQLNKSYIEYEYDERLFEYLQKIIPIIENDKVIKSFTIDFKD